MQLELPAVATVFYKPDSDSINTFIRLADYGYFVVIYNNGLGAQLPEEIIERSNIRILGDGTNVGLATGLNECLRYIWSNSEIESVVLFDQDSKPEDNLPTRLQQSHASFSQSEKVGCLGPRIIDIKSTSNSPRKLKREEKDFLLAIATSGTHIFKSTFIEVGPFRDDLFIDCIDYEWCFRAISKGYKIAKDSNCTLAHDMGERGINFLGSYKPTYRSPTRHYYIFRNTIALFYLDHTPVLWKCEQTFKLIRRAVYYVLTSDNSLVTVKNIIKAIADGTKGRMGELA